MEKTEIISKEKFDKAVLAYCEKSNVVAIVVKKKNVVQTSIINEKKS